jgi:hypothetical protein
MQYEEAIKYISTGESVLFVGSFFSKNSVNKNGQKVPDAYELKDNLLKALDKDPTNYTQNSLAQVATSAQKGLSYKNYQKLLKDNFTVISADKDAKIIALKSWATVFTTNYDNLVEHISGRVSVSPYSSTDLIYDDKDFVYHLNGVASDLRGKQEDSQKIVLSTSDYYLRDFSFSPMIKPFKEEIENAKSIFLVGFSGDSDLEIIRNLFDKYNHKTFLINGDKQLNDIEIDTISGIGTNTNKTMSEFADDISSISKQLTPSKKK